MNHSDKDSDWLIVKCFISVQSMLTTLLFALEIKFVLKIEKLYFFRAPAASCVLYNKTEHRQGFSICYLLSLSLWKKEM